MLPMAAELSADVEAFIAAFSENWHASGQGRTEGRLLAYLLVVSTDKVSSADLAEAMGAGTGAISMATRALVEQGFIRRLRVSSTTINGTFCTRCLARSARRRRTRLAP
jgi:DNA-binding transcriptional regulator GbsR (MarR family)